MVRVQPARKLLFKPVVSECLHRQRFRRWITPYPHASTAWETVGCSNLVTAAMGPLALRAPKCASASPIIGWAVSLDIWQDSAARWPRYNLNHLKAYVGEPAEFLVLVLQPKVLVRTQHKLPQVVCAC